MKYATWYDNGTGYLEFLQIIEACSAAEAAEQAARQAPYGYAVVTALGKDPERDGKQVILAEASAPVSITMFNFNK